MFVKSGVFGVYDFAFTSIRGFVFVKAFCFLHGKTDDADDFAEYERKFKKIQAKATKKSVQTNFFWKVEHTHKSHYQTQAKSKYKQYTSTRPVEEGNQFFQNKKRQITKNQKHRKPKKTNEKYQPSNYVQSLEHSQSRKGFEFLEFQEHSI